MGLCLYMCTTENVHYQAQICTRPVYDDFYGVHVYLRSNHISLQPSYLLTVHYQAQICTRPVYDDFYGVHVYLQSNHISLQPSYLLTE